ncbi:hypothetical protein KR054_011145 [Drosophila jambulina]|nr:hypothetical protein KR054_011145 [Drosophila jambulina]
MELTDIRLRSVMQFDPIKCTFELSQRLKYFRQPSWSEYPLDLNRGYDTYVHRNGVFPGPFDQVQQYLMQVDEAKQVLQETDFVLHRRTLMILMNANVFFKNRTRFEAFRSKGCIFLKIGKESEGARGLRNSYSFKARQYLMTERLGEAPDTDAPIDERIQQYGMFSAKIGQFRLLYSGELTGLANTEPLGDLTDQKELDKCRLTTIRVVKPKVASWRTNSQFGGSWIRQAYLTGAKQLVVARFNDKGHVVQPIEVESVESLLQQTPRSNIGDDVQRIHQCLEMISQKLKDIDDPAVSVKFQFINKKLVLEEHLGTDFLVNRVQTVNLNAINDAK